MVIFAVFVVGEGKFTVLVWFLGKVELVGVVVAGIWLFAVCDLAGRIISNVDPAYASSCGQGWEGLTYRKYCHS